MGCTAATDRDCVGCGNGRLEGSERCDPLSTCPTSCPAMRCQRYRLLDPQTCTARCDPIRSR